MVNMVSFALWARYPGGILDKRDDFDFVGIGFIKLKL